MTIKRVIGGKEFEIKLSEQELYAAYCEQEREFDISSCNDYYDCMYWDEDWYDNKDLRENIIEEAATNLRRNIDKYDMSFDYAIAEAFADAVREYVKEEE